jgi:hypothetical protein
MKKNNLKTMKNNWTFSNMRQENNCQENKLQENKWFSWIVDKYKDKVNFLLLLTGLFSWWVFAEEQNTEIEYKRYESELRLTKTSAQIVVRFRTQDQLNNIWSTRRFIAEDDRYKLKPLAFVLHDPNGTCNIYIPKPKLEWNDDHMLRELWHEVLHCLWAKHE